MINLILYLTYAFSYITFPLFTFSNNEYNQYENRIFNLLDNKLYTYLTIGEPPQKIAALIMPDEYPLYIYNNLCEINSNFIVEKSKSYISSKYEVQYLTNITLSYLIKDKFEFEFNETNEKKYIESIIYHYRPYNNSNIKLEKKYPYTCAYIGLKIPKYNSEEYSHSLFLQLKKLRIINNHCFFIIYGKNHEGKLIIGDYPEIYEPNNYKKYQLKTIYSLYLENKYNWRLKFNSIYFESQNRKISLNHLEANIDLTSELIFSPKEYIDEIYKYFFEEKINKGLCHKKYIDKKIEYFSCNSLETIENFPTLYFRHSFLLYTFELNYNDLFKIINNEYIFLICYNEEFENEWIFGKPFLKKYLFVFNYDEKVIGFYNPLINENGDLIESNSKLNNNNSNKKNIIFIIVIFIFVFIIFFMISKRIYRKRKINKAWQNNKQNPKVQELFYTNIDKDKNIN